MLAVTRTTRTTVARALTGCAPAAVIGSITGLPAQTVRSHQARGIGQPATADGAAIVLAIVPAQTADYISRTWPHPQGIGGALVQIAREMARDDLATNGEADLGEVTDDAG